MRYYIDYVIFNEKGRIRAKNQDNFWCDNIFLESQNEGLLEPITGKTNITENPLFAVFDGMGGGNRGEIAAYIAANTFNSYVSNYKSNKTKTDSEGFLSAICNAMNVDICSYAGFNRAGNMGATTAILSFNKNGAYVCNLGDSKIFCLSNGKLSQLSEDHVMTLHNGRKAVLTQHLGIPQNECAIEPYISVKKFNGGDKFLICSDGLTDSVALTEIEKTLSVVDDVSSCAGLLMDTALSNGGTDNITIILSVIRKGWK